MDYDEMFERSSGFNDIHDIEEEMNKGKNLVAVCDVCGECSNETEMLLNDGKCFGCETPLN